MKTKIQKIAKILIVISLIFISTSASAFASEINEENILNLTNKARVEAGLKGLTLNQNLSVAAKAKAEDMFKNQYFEHTSPEGVTPWYWFEEADYDYVYAAENLAIDFRTAEGTHKALMKSTGHRENILGVNYTEIGIATVKGIFEGRETIIVVQEFGSREYGKVNGEMIFEKPENIETITIEEKIVLEEEEKEDICEKSGLVLPRVFSIKDPVMLRNTYTINIYWEESEDGNLVSSESYKIKTANLLARIKENLLKIELSN